MQGVVGNQCQAFGKETKLAVLFPELNLYTATLLHWLISDKCELPYKMHYPERQKAEVLFEKNKTQSRQGPKIPIT